MIDVILASLAGAVVAMLFAWALWARPLAAARVECDDARRDAGALRGEADLQREEVTRQRDEVARQREARGGHAVEVKMLQERVAALAAAETGREALTAQLAGLEAERAERDRAHAAELARLHETFAGLAARALDGAQAQFLERAEARFAEHKTLSETGMQALLAPVAETLTRYEGALKSVEAARAEAYGGLSAQVAALAAGHAQFSGEAAKLVSALRSSGKTSGSWGEQQLRNTLEMAGLREGIDFTLQASGDDGGKRPDAVIRLPGDRQLIVDSKCSLKDYLDAAEADGEDGRRAAFRRHAAAVRVHARGLSEKSYWKDFGASADFVVMFLPGENFLSAAMEHDLPLLGWAFEQRILLTGPINLLALAKIVAMVWRQETQAEQWREIGKLGADLHAAIATMAEHLAGVGKNLGQAVNGYNAFVGSLERNVLPKARRFTDLGVDEGKKPVPLLSLVDTFATAPNAPELRLAAPAEAAE